jgi:dynein heavy chain 1
MNPSGDDLRERSATSPALFNRCVVNWFGDWSNKALYQVGNELTSMLEIAKQDYNPPAHFEPVCELIPQKVQYRHAVINIFVQIHNTVRKINEVEAKKGHRTMALTPRHFLDLIKHYTKLFKEKRHDLEEEKIHLNNGLRKIRETEEQVKELKQSLTLKRTELERKQEEANTKLKQMLSDQQEAEKEKKESEKLQKRIEEETKKIDVKKTEVESDLSQVLPTVEEAKKAVQAVGKKVLSIIKTMQNPPDAIKLTLESVCLLLRENAPDWRTIQKVIVKDDFKSRILEFKTDSITQNIVDGMAKYVNNADWNFEKVGL